MSQLFVIAGLMSLLYVAINVKSKLIPVENDTVHKGRWLKLSDQESKSLLVIFILDSILIIMKLLKDMNYGFKWINFC